MLNPSLKLVLAAIIASLVIGTIVRLIAVRHVESERRRKRLASLATWWVLVIVVVLATSLGTVGVCLVLALCAIMGLRELAGFIAKMPCDRWSVWFLNGFTLLYFWWIAMARPEAVSGLVPMGIVLGVCSTQVLQGDTQDYVRRTAGLAWGGLLLIFGLSHAALLTTLPDSTNPVAGPMGWFLFLVLLTESNDISQALVGRKLGGHKKHRITPTVSPNKTWEGFLGGMIVTVVLSICFAPLLTPLHDLSTGFRPGDPLVVPLLWPTITGVLVSLGGLLGDINLSALKRDVGVKDSGELLPGMGGMLDRIDSLTFTAPMFYCLVRWLTL